MNYKEIKEILFKLIEENGLQQVCYELNEKNNEFFPENFPTFEKVKSIGGYEGNGDYVERVYAFENENGKVYVRVTGFYSSYGGDTEWDEEFTEVFPKEKLITVYEEKENEEN